MERKVVIVHHNDMDGIFSGAIIYDYEKNIKQVSKDGIDTVGMVVRPGTFQFVCQKCGENLDRWYDARWVAMRPGKGRRHGYSISQMDKLLCSN